MLSKNIKEQIEYNWEFKYNDIDMWTNILEWKVRVVDLCAMTLSWFIGGNRVTKATILNKKVRQVYVFYGKIYNSKD